MQNRRFSTMAAATTPHPTPHLQRWRDADRAATEASRVLLEKTIAFYEARGPEPTVGDRMRVSELREQSQLLYRKAMAEMDELSTQLRGQQ